MRKGDKGYNSAAQGGIGIGVLSVTPKAPNTSVPVTSGQPNMMHRGQEGTMRAGKTS